MPTPQSSFIIKQYDGFGGSFVDSDYLGAAYETMGPHVFEGTLAKLYSSRSRFFSSKPLVGMLGVKPTSILEIPTEIYRWRLQGAEYRAARIIENVESGNTTPGLNGTTFRIKLDADFYRRPDVLLSEDNELPLAIVDGPYFDGTGSIYTVRIQSDNPTLFLDPKYLDAGREFCKGWTSTASEANDEYGTQYTANSFMLESQVGFFAQKISVTDKAMREQGRLGIEFIATDYQGNESKVEKFIPYYEAKMWDELYRTMEVQLLLGKKSTQPGPDKYWVKTGQSGPLSIVILIEKLL